MQQWSPAMSGRWLLPGSGCFARCPKASGLWGGESSCACRSVNGTPGMEPGKAKITIKASVHGNPGFWTQCFIQHQKASKGGETGRRESVIGCFGNPFLKDNGSSDRNGVTAHPLRAALWEGWESPCPIEPGGAGSCPPRWHCRQCQSRASHLLSSPWAKGSWSRGGRRTDTAAPGQERGWWGCPQPLLALPAVAVFITGDVPFRQILSLVLDFCRVMARLRCPCTLPWVPHAPTPTQDLVPPPGNVADGQ